jgi:antitoxin MazE
MYITVKKWGNSHAIRIPKKITEALNISENENVEIIAGTDEIIIRKLRKHKTFEERMAGYDGDYKFTEMDSGEPVGREVF